MTLIDCQKYLFQLFNTSSEIKDELAFTSKHRRWISTVGYATNLTPEVVRLAAKKNVDLVLTHHDAWGFIFGMDKDCRELLRKNRISHFYAHLPLDGAQFGTNVSFINRIGARVIAKTTREDGYWCGRIAEFSPSIRFDQLVRRVERLCDEKVMRWQNHHGRVRRVGFISGAGLKTSYIKEMVDKKCDVFITGEKNLYTVEYARHVGINMIVGSHTFTEIFGVETLAGLLKSTFPELSVLRLTEAHIETA